VEETGRFRGALLGLAAGDALGTALEFSRPGSLEPIADMVGGGPFGLEPGQWTDDTSMALCLAESILERRGFDPVDQLSRYVRWRRDGHLSSTGECFDVGGTVSAALLRFERTGEAYCGETGPQFGGNGSLMRLAPVPMAWAWDPARAIEHAGNSSRTTHAAPEPVDACRYFAGLIAGALAGEPKETLLAPRWSPLGGWRDGELEERIDALAAGSFKEREPPEVRGTGYVVHCLEAALWAFHRSGSFEEGALMAVNLGDDADTTGAVYGQIAGACYGARGIPEPWRAKLALLETLETMADGLRRFAEARAREKPESETRISRITRESDGNG